MKDIHSIVFFILVISLQPVHALSQSFSSQYIVIYQADTVNRLQAYPPVYIPTQLKIYVKNNSYRIELTCKSRTNPLDSNKVVEIKNEQGIYTTVEESDPFINREIKNLYLHFSTKEVESIHIIQDYSVEKVRPVQWLKVKASKITYRDSSNVSKEAVFTKQINIPVLFYFKSLPSSFGSPLQFTDAHDGWNTSYTAVSIKEVVLDEKLFQINPNHQLIPASKN